MLLTFSAKAWLAQYEAAGGRFLIVGPAALVTAPWPHSRARKLQDWLLRDRRKWVAVYQLAAARGA